MMKEDAVPQLPEKGDKRAQVLQKSEYTPPRLTIYGDVARITEDANSLGSDEMPVGGGPMS